MNNELTCIARIVAKEGCAEAMQQLLTGLLEPTRNEDGNISYNLNKSTENPNAFTMVEEFKSQEAFEFHAAQPYFKAFQAEVGELLESIDISTYKKQ